MPQPASSSMRPMASLGLYVLLASFGTSATNVALPTLAREFAASFQTVQWVTLAYLLAITALLVGVGRLGDRIGRGRLLDLGVLLFLFASALCAVSPALPMLVAARAAQGMGAAVMLALTMAIASDLSGISRGRAMGMLAAVSAAGTAIGPTLGGILVAHAGWQSLFLVNIPVGAAALWLTRGSLPPDRATLAAPARSPLRDRFVAASLAANLLVSTVIMTTLVVGPFYLERALHLTPAHAGLVLSTGPIVAALAGIPSGYLVDRGDALRLRAIGLVGIGGGALLLALVPGTSGVMTFTLPLAVLTSGYALFQTANNTAVMARVDGNARGTVSGMINFTRFLGLLAGASAMGAVFDHASGADVSSASPHAITQGMRTTFAMAAALVALALAATRATREARSHALPEITRAQA